jgi:DtxR family Mn-dependent transcriptional regulator
MNNIELCESQEDYIKVISKISSRNPGGWVSNSEIANELQIKPSSVTNMLHKLKDLNIIKWDPRKSIRLTKKGKSIAKKLNTRYKILIDFFTNILKLSDEDAIKRFCCEIEHKTTPEIFSQLIQINQNQEKFSQNILSVQN